jgi:uncharacterized membrane protein
MIKKVFYVLLAILAISIGLYPSLYFFTTGRFGILQSKTDAVLSNPFWNIEFYTHISLGGLALLIGWTQFNTKWRTNKLRLHKLIGKIYIVAALLSAQAAIYIALYAQGGVIASLGFICLGIIWFYTTLSAYIKIKSGRTAEHQKMMIYSYAACAAAITLRVYLYPLIFLLHDFIKAYVLVAWLCWVPNLIVAYLLVRRIEKRKSKTIKSIAAIGADHTQYQQ